MKASKTLLFVAIGGGLFVAAIVSCGGLLFFKFRQTDSEFSPLIDELFAAIEKGTFSETYDTHTSPELRQVSTQETYEQLGDLIKTRLGSLKSKKLTHFKFRKSTVGTFTDLAYNARFENGPGTIRVTFKRDGDRWLIAGFHVNSPVFLKDLATAKCPHCGEPHTVDAEFCPKCGKPLASDPETAAPRL